MNKTIYLLIAIISIVLISRFMNKTKNGLKSGAYNTTWLKNKDVLFSAPDSPETTKKSQIMVIISGQFRSNPEWFFNHIPLEVKNSRYIVIGAWDIPLYETIKYGQNEMDKLGIIDAGVSSVTGFSAGGSNILREYEKNTFGRVMILDPAVSPVQEHKEFGNEVIFLYGSNLHDKYNTYADEYDTIVLNVIKNGGIVEELNFDHYDFPYYGFNKYKNEL
tara:strand:+ start:2779 stop:3435 length:657 start_codon:yes stop_codon:yes gene_type:complete